MVGDKEEIGESLSKILKGGGHKVSSVNSGADAFKLLRKNSYDLLICDLVMPDVSVRVIMKAVKAINKEMKTGLIIGWKYGIEDAEKDGLKADFVIKEPLNLSELRKNINNLWI